MSGHDPHYLQVDSMWYARSHVAVTDTLCAPQTHWKILWTPNPEPENRGLPMRLDGVGQLRTQMQRKLSFRSRGRQPRGDGALHLFKRRLFEVFQKIT